MVGKSVTTWELTVNHKDIPGLMPAMIMAYKVTQPVVVQRIQIGDLITGDVIVADGGNTYLLDHINVTGHQGRQFQYSASAHARRARPGCCTYQPGWKAVPFE